MKLRCRILALFLLAGVFSGSALRPVDLPETAFDESDAPVNLYLPPSQALAIFVRPAGGPLAVSSFIVTSTRLRVAAMPRPRHPQSLQKLLSAFLI